MKGISKIILAGMATVSLGAYAGPSWITNPATGDCYALTSGPLTWHEAEAEAVSYGGHLVAVNDAAENAWLVATFGADRMWIGFNDEASEGSFVWSNGDPVTYTNWGAGEPNDITHEDWTVMNWYADGGWNDWEAGADYIDGTGFLHAMNDSYPVYGIMEKACVPDGGLTLGMFGAATGLLLALRRRLA